MLKKLVVMSGIALLGWAGGAALLAWLAGERISHSFLPTPLAEAVLEEPWPAGLELAALLTGGDRLHRGARE